MNITKTVAGTTAAVLASLAVGAVAAAEPASASGSSIKMSIQKEINDATTTTMKGTCPAGYHIRGEWSANLGSGNDIFDPTIGVDGSYISHVAGTTSGTAPFDRQDLRDNDDPAKWKFFAGWQSDIRNWSLRSSHTATVSWTCDSNPS